MIKPIPTTFQTIASFEQLEIVVLSLRTPSRPNEITPAISMRTTYPGEYLLQKDCATEYKVKITRGDPETGNPTTIYVEGGYFAKKIEQRLKARHIPFSRLPRTD